MFDHHASPLSPGAGIIAFTNTEELDRDPLTDQRRAESAEQLGDDEYIAGPVADRIHDDVGVLLPTRRIITRWEGDRNRIVAPGLQSAYDSVPVAFVPRTRSARTLLATSLRVYPAEGVPIAHPSLHGLASGGLDERRTRHHRVHAFHQRNTATVGP